MGRKKKKNKAPPPPPGGQALPPPPGAMPLPPPPSALDPLPVPEVTAGQDPKGILQSPSLPDLSVAGEEETPDVDENYTNLWERRSSKPLQQVYGHIDRLGTGETGSLLDRYADRFGHELDREIIVLRGKDNSDAESAVRDAPTVELLDDDDDADVESHEMETEESIEDTPPSVESEDESSEYNNELDSDEQQELETQLELLEDEIKRLKPKYQSAKKKGQRSKLDKLKPALKALIDERKLIIAVLSGEESIDSLASEPVVETDEDQFVQLVGIVDDLLGKMPEDAINDFLSSPEFEVYKEVAGSPEDAGSEMRVEFFEIVDSKLGQMPEDAINEFIASDDFAIYQAVGSELRS